MTTDVEPAVIDRIKKLLARATSSEPHEAALALEMAQKMMAQHNLTTEAVEVGPIKETSVRSVATKSKAKGWELSLMRGVADAFSCDLMFQSGQSWDEMGYRVTDSRMYAHYLFIGTAHESKLAGYACEVLLRQLVRARARFTQSLPAHYTRGEKTGEVDAYLSGWVRSALAKVSKLQVRPAVRDAIKKYVERKSGGGKGVGVQQRSGSSEAQQRGAADGATVDLNRPVDGGREAKGLGRGAAGLLGEGRKP